MNLKERDRGEVYDRLVRLADRILAKNYVCAGCPVGCKGQWPSRATCCSDCPNLGPSGCTVKALACKLWLCWNEKYKAGYRVNKRLHRLERIAQHYRIYVGRAGKEMSLELGAKGIKWAPNHGG